jgi:hypothetical protein
MRCGSSVSCSQVILDHVPVRAAVGLDDEFRRRPVEVDLVTLDLPVDDRHRQAVLAHELEEPPLQLVPSGR